MFIEGQEYSRVRDIHERFDGQRQGGISTPSKHPYVFIFTVNLASSMVCRRLEGGRCFLYTGEGQVVT